MLRKSLSVLLVVLLTVVAPARSWDGCDDVRAERDRAKAARDKILANKLPEDRLADIDNLLGQVVDLLDANNKDQKTVIDKIDELSKRLPASDAPIVKSINQLLKGVKDGLSGTAKVQKDASEFLSGVRGRLNVLQKFYEAGDAASAQQQIAKFGEFFDGMRRLVPGVDQIPGLKDVFDAYSQGIQGIAKSAGRIEDIVKRNNQIYRDAGFEGDLYLRTKTPREIRADQVRRLTDAMAAAEARLADGCGEPAGNKCANPSSRVVLDMHALNAKLGPGRALQIRQDDAIAAIDSEGATQTPAAMRRYLQSAAVRKSHTEAYENELGKLLDLTSRTNKWTPAEEQLFADCFPYSWILRDRARMHPKSAPTNPALPPPGKNCGGGDSLSGVLEGVAKQEGGCK